MSKWDRTPRVVLAALSLFALAVATACGARSSAGTASAPALDEWERVMRLTCGTIVTVETGSETIAGRLVSAETDRLTILTRGTESTVARSGARRVTMSQRLTRQKAGRGFGVGALAGGLVGALTTRSNRVPWATMLAAGWGAMGALFGAIDGASDRRVIVVYEAPAVAQRPLISGGTTGLLPHFLQ